MSRCVCFFVCALNYFLCNDMFCLNATHMAGDSACTFGVSRVADSRRTDTLFASMCMWNGRTGCWEMHGFLSFFKYVDKVEAMHSGMGYLHRDLKPGNMLLRFGGANNAVCVDMELIDFGNAMKIDEETAWGASAVYDRLEGFFPPEICFATLADHSTSSAWTDRIREVFKTMNDHVNSDADVFIQDIQTLDAAFSALIAHSSSHPTVVGAVRSMRGKLQHIIKKGKDRKCDVPGMIHRVQMAVQLRCSIPTDTYALVRMAAVVVNFMRVGAKKWIDKNQCRPHQMAPYHHQMACYESEWRKLYIELLTTPALYSGSFIERGAEGSPGSQASVFLRWLRDHLAEIDSRACTAASSTHRDLDHHRGGTRAALVYDDDL